MGLKSNTDVNFYKLLHPFQSADLHAQVLSIELTSTNPWEYCMTLFLFPNC